LSLVVYPVADLPRVARETGAKLVIVNAEETPYDRSRMSSSANGSATSCRRSSRSS